MKILLRVAFLGTNYCGYQVQPNGISIQQRLNEAARSLFGFECDIVGCSRTDSGVHARDFCVTVAQKKQNSICTSIPVEKIPMAFAQRLPNDIAVISAEEVDDSFHPRYDVKYKEYVYKIWNKPYRDPFMQGRAWHCPRVVSAEGIESMKEAAKHFCGTQDFSSYMAADSKITDAVRTIYESEVSVQDGMITFRVSADGFLYNMVRILVGTLMDVGYGRISPQDIDAITRARDRRAAGSTAPAEGLYLNKVVY